MLILSHQPKASPPPTSAPGRPVSQPCEKPASPPITEEVLYDYFLKQEEGHSADHLAFLDRGIDNSHLKDEIPAYPSRLRSVQGPSLNYPCPGQIPEINEQGLNFLNPEITHACVAVGRWENGSLKTRWSGRQAQAPAQMWSATKIYPMLRSVILAGGQVDNCSVVGSGQTYPVSKAFDSIVSYREGGSASNRLARMFKHFDTPSGQENWLKSLTGNRSLTFRGGYGEAAAIERPTMIDSLGQVVLRASGEQHRGQNLVSAYDLARGMAEIGWNKVEGLKDPGSDTMVKALACDSARFMEAAWEALGILDRIAEPVVLSKMGFGLSDERNQWEEVYSAFVQFRDRLTGKLHQFSLGLKAVKAPGDQAPQKLDARMAAQVALITQNVLEEKL